MAFKSCTLKKLILPGLTICCSFHQRGKLPPPPEIWRNGGNVPDTVKVIGAFTDFNYNALKTNEYITSPLCADVLFYQSFTNWNSF